MTIQDAIRTVRTLKPHPYSDEDMTRWLSDLDGQIHGEIMAGHEGAPPAPGAYRIGNDMDTELLVGSPYEDVYIKYLSAQVDYHNAEYERYNNAMMMYNTQLMAFAAWYNRTHMPLQNWIGV